MEKVISDLLKEYEGGRVSRRDLIRGLAVAVTASAAAGSASAAGGYEVIALDHVSYQVADYRQTRDFYQGLLGMAVSGDDGERQCSLGFGDATLIARNHRTEEAKAAGPKVDHIAYKIKDWNTDAVESELERRGLAPRLDTGGGDGYASFHVKDPDGFTVQISGDPMPGDRLYPKK